MHLLFRDSDTRGDVEPLFRNSFGVRIKILFEESHFVKYRLLVHGIKEWPSPNLSFLKSDHGFGCVHGTGIVQYNGIYPVDVLGIGGFRDMNIKKR